MRRALVQFLAVLIALLISGAAASTLSAAEPKNDGDVILGKWWFPKRNGKMVISREGDVYSGKVVEYDKPEQIDDKNPDPALKGRKFLGILMVKDFKYEPEEKRWAGGTIYDAESGKTYKSRMWLDEGKPDQLNVRGFVGLSVFGRTEVFNRVTKEDEEKAAKAAAEAESAAEKAKDKAEDKTGDAK